MPPCVACSRGWARAEDDPVGGTAILTVQLLGERCLLAGGRNVSAAIHYRKGWALLGYLAVERGRRLPREQVAQLLWPSLEPASARTNLRQVLADLNQAVDTHGGAGLLEVTRESVGLFPSAAATVDLVALDRADAEPAAVEPHVARFGGEFLAGLSLPECDEYEEWLQATRRELGLRSISVLGRLCAAQQAAARWPQAVASARRLVTLDGWNETHQRLLMSLLASAGLHQQALEAYEALRVNLAAELGTTPEPATQALRARIEADRRRAAGPGRPIEPAPAPQHSGTGGNDIGAPTQRTMPIPAPRPAVCASATGWLEVVQGTGCGRRVPVGGAPLVVGRSRDSDLCIAHDTVSRHHCTVWQAEGGFRVRDLGSTNRTRVNDAIVEEAELADGDRIVLGETVLRFSARTG